jgi:hypothetical protein
MRTYTKLGIAISLTMFLITSACAQSPTDKQENIQPETKSESTEAEVVKVLDLEDIAPQDTATVPAPPTSGLPEEPSPTSTNSSVPDNPPITVSPSPTKSCTDEAELVRHLSIRNNTILLTNQAYGKVWLVKNVGTCTWTTEYSLVFVDGNTMQSPEKMQLTEDIAPGGTIELRISLIAPDEEGEYQARWMLNDEFGNPFGIGDESDQPLAVHVFVRQSPPPKEESECP